MKTKVDSFEDIIFENRNKEYGAYELRRKYSKRGTIAMVIALVIVSFAVGGPLIAGIINHNINPIHLDSLTGVEFTKIPDDAIVPPPPPPAPAPPVRAITFVAPIIVDQLSEPDLELATTDDLSKNANSGNVDTTIRIIVPDKPIGGEVIEDQTIYEPVTIQEKPLFLGGDSELLKFVGINTKYPQLAIEGGIEGTVYIRFVVTKTGSIGAASVMRPIDPLLDEEALRVVKTLPKWTPGKNNGNPVNVWFIIPVKFQLK